MKEIKRVLEEILNEGIQGGFIPNEYGNEKINLAEAEIKKIFNEWVGEDRTYDIDPTSCEPVNEMDRGYNQRGAEIRKKLEGEL